MGDHPLSNRLASFQELRDEARLHAESAGTAELRAVYQDLADSWEELISEIEATTIIEPNKRW